MYHLHISYLAKHRNGSAASSMNYIARRGQFKKKKDKVRKFISVMPSWVDKKHALAYWEAADSFRSRANARVGYTVEAAFPKVLTAGQQRTLAVEFAHELARRSAEGLTPHASMPFSLAIHEGFGRNPHLHLLLSSSIDDRVKRPPASWFKRYNPKNPELGGAKRARLMGKKKWLKETRELWATLGNKMLVACGFPPVLDHRSNSDRNISTAPGIHLGPSATYLVSQNRPSPRAMRSAALKKKFEEMESLREQIARRQVKISWMEIEQALEQYDRLKWVAINEGEWEDILDRHPLALDVKTLRGAASVVVLQPESAQVHAIYRDGIDLQHKAKVLEAVGPRWDWVQTPAGIWLVTPDSDEVVFMDVGISTDATSEPGIHAALSAAKTRSDQAAVVWARKSVLDVVAEGMARLSLEWPVKVWSGSGKRPKPK